MTIGIIGAGKLGFALARLFTAAGHDVVIANKQGPQSLLRLEAELAPRLKAGTPTQAAAAEVVILALPWRALASTLPTLGPWTGRLVIDATNPVMAPDAPIEPLGGRSSTQVVASMLPGAAVVKAFNTLPPQLLMRSDAGQRVVFIAGDDEEGKTKVSALVKTLDFFPIDLGGLESGARLSQFPGGPLPGLNLLRFG